MDLGDGAAAAARIDNSVGTELLVKRAARDLQAGGRLVHVKELDGQVTDYSYDAKNRMITVMQNGNLILTNEYDAADRVIRQTLPDGRAYTFKYWLDHAGQVVAADARDSAGLTWKISMSGGAQYTLKPIRGQ